MIACNFGSLDYQKHLIRTLLFSRQGMEQETVLRAVIAISSEFHLAKEQLVFSEVCFY